MKKITISIIFFMLLITSFGNQIQAEENTNVNVIITSMDINIDIKNAYAITEISAFLTNIDDQAHEKTFNINIPEDAFVSNFTLILDGKNYYAEILEKQEAEEKYEEAVEHGQTAAKTDTRDLKQFSYSINIKANQTIQAKLKYEQYLTKKLGEREYKLAINNISEQQITFFNMTLNLFSNLEITSLDITEWTDDVDVQYPDVYNTIINMNKNNYMPNKDFTLTYKENSPPTNGTLKSYYKLDEDKYYFFNIFSPQKSDIGGGIPKDIIFILDRSGSMEGNKIIQLKDAFINIIDKLHEEDRFTFIIFNDNINIYSQELIEVNNDNKENAIDYINKIEATGSTNIYDGLSKALDILNSEEGRTPIIVLLTDGLPNTGTYSTPAGIRTHIKEENNIVCPIFTLGFGDDVDFDFLTALSLENYATSKKIYAGSDASEQIKNFYDTISTTLLRDITVEYNPECYYVYPTSITSLFEGSEKIIAGQFSKINNLTSTFSAITKYGERTFTSTYQINDTLIDDDYIWRYWAFSRINALLDEIEIGGKQDNIVNEIVNLSIMAHFVTPYTSLYIELEDFSTSERELSSSSSKDSSFSVAQKDRSAESTPGFELILILLALIIVLYRNKKRKD